MFFCDKCAEKNGWPTSFMRSRGPCEVCGYVAVCSDIPSRALPESKPPAPLHSSSAAKEKE